MIPAPAIHTSDPSNTTSLHSTDSQDDEISDFVNPFKLLRHKLPKRSVLEGEEAFLQSPLHDDISKMARTLSLIPTRTRFSNHDDHQQLSLCGAAALLDDPDLTGMAWLNINLVEGETPASVLSAIRKRITRSNDGQAARYFGVSVHYAKQKARRGGSPTFHLQPHIHLIVLDCPKDSQTYDALHSYCRRRGKVKEARSGNIKPLDHDLWWTVGYLQKNLSESQAAGQQHVDEVVISKPIREIADAIGQGEFDMAEKIKALQSRPADVDAQPTISDTVLAEFEKDAPVMVRVVGKLTADGLDRVEAVRRVVGAWTVIRGFRPPSGE